MITEYATEPITMTLPRWGWALSILLAPTLVAIGAYLAYGAIICYLISDPED